MSLVSPLAGMDKRVVQTQLKTTVVKAKFARNFLLGSGMGTMSST
jgi:hypothetical protein